MNNVSIKENNLKNAYNSIINLENYNAPTELYGSFYNYLFNLFALREGKGKKDTENQRPHLKEDTIFGALKYIYEIYKHSNDNNIDFTKLNVFVSKKQYPYTYPYTYGSSYAYFCVLSEDLINTQDKEVHKQRFKFLYNKYLAGLTIKNIVVETFEQQIKENNNG